MLNFDTEDLIIFTLQFKTRMLTSEMNYISWLKVKVLKSSILFEKRIKFLKMIRDAPHTFTLSYFM